MAPPDRPAGGGGYRLRLPDLRGYGDCDAPSAVEEYAIDVLARDVLGLLDHADAEQGTVIGHDWSADLAWKTAWLHPERVRAVGGFRSRLRPGRPAADRHEALALGSASRRPTRYSTTELR